MGVCNTIYICNEIMLYNNVKGESTKQFIQRIQRTEDLTNSKKKKANLFLTCYFSFDGNKFPEQVTFVTKNVGSLMNTMVESVGRAHHASGKYFGSDNFGLKIFK